MVLNKQMRINIPGRPTILEIHLKVPRDVTAFMDKATSLNLTYLGKGDCMYLVTGPSAALDKLQSDLRKDLVSFTVVM
jgi:hypothetical protein